MWTRRPVDSDGQAASWTCCILDPISVFVDLPPPCNLYRRHHWPVTSPKDGTATKYKSVRDKKLWSPLIVTVYKTFHEFFFYFSPSKKALHTYIYMCGNRELNWCNLLQYSCRSNMLSAIMLYLHSQFKYTQHWQYNNYLSTFYLYLFKRSIFSIYIHLLQM